MDDQLVVASGLPQASVALAFRIAFAACGIFPVVALAEGEASARVLRELTAAPLMLAQAETNIQAQVQPEVPPLPTADISLAPAAQAASGASPAGQAPGSVAAQAAGNVPSALPQGAAQADLSASAELRNSEAVSAAAPLPADAPAHAAQAAPASAQASAAVPLAPAAAPAAAAPAGQAVSVAAADPLAELRVGPAAGPNDLWKGLSVAVVFLGALAGGGVMLVKGRKRGIFQRPEREMEVLSSLSISPKRQILLVRIRDQEFAVACTEQGLSFLSEVGQKAPAAAAYVQAEARVQAAPRAARPFLGNDAKRVQGESALALEAHDGNGEAEAADIRSIAQRIRTFAQGERRAQEATQPAARAETKLRTNAAPAPTAGRAFPKYLAKSFEAEGQRAPQARPAAPMPPQRMDAESESVENVTNMIRAKLKEMKA